ncbi:unnamed protein product [Paramecium octaurelia]|uniref:Transmembrane protein n=1 Tax=Paramecium octaurelia TaxID=43137 RepID=A0A8S1XT40_PAROT|nr:unnamed protein product [Paramecium octaurelia]
MNIMGSFISLNLSLIMPYFWLQNATICLIIPRTVFMIQALLSLIYITFFIAIQSYRIPSAISSRMVELYFFKFITFLLITQKKNNANCNNSIQLNQYQVNITYAIEFYQQFDICCIRYKFTNLSTYSDILTAYFNSQIPHRVNLSQNLNNLYLEGQLCIYQLKQGRHTGHKDLLIQSFQFDIHCKLTHYKLILCQLQQRVRDYPKQHQTQFLQFNKKSIQLHMECKYYLQQIYSIQQQMFLFCPLQLLSIYINSLFQFHPPQQIQNNRQDQSMYSHRQCYKIKFRIADTHSYLISQQCLQTNMQQVTFNSSIQNFIIYGCQMFLQINFVCTLILERYYSVQLQKMKILISMCSSKYLINIQRITQMILKNYKRIKAEFHLVSKIDNANQTMLYRLQEFCSLSHHSQGQYTAK